MTRPVTRTAKTLKIAPLSAPDAREANMRRSAFSPLSRFDYCRAREFFKHLRRLRLRLGPPNVAPTDLTQKQIKTLAQLMKDIDNG